MDHLRPVWMRNYLPLQKDEVERFVWGQFFGALPKPIIAFYPHLSQVWAETMGSRTIIGLNASQWVALNNDLWMVRKKAAETVEVIQVLQRASVSQKRKVERSTFLSWIFDRIPDRDPAGRMISKSQKLEMASLCYKNRNCFYQSCPAMAVESQLEKIRSSDPNRRPQASDAIDLIHGVLAISYCDYYITRDRFARRCANDTKMGLPFLRTAHIYKDMTEFVAAMGPEAAEEGAKP